MVQAVTSSPSESPGLKSRSRSHVADLLNGLSLIFLIFKMGMILILTVEKKIFFYFILFLDFT